jgi:hypothetical protein
MYLFKWANNYFLNFFNCKLIHYLKENPKNDILVFVLLVHCWYSTEMFCMSAIKFSRDVTFKIQKYSRYDAFYTTWCCILHHMMMHFTPHDAAFYTTWCCILHHMMMHFTPHDDAFYTTWCCILHHMMMHFTPHDDAFYTTWRKMHHTGCISVFRKWYIFKKWLMTCKTLWDCINNGLIKQIPKYHFLGWKCPWK